MDEPLNTAPCGFLSIADDGAILDVNATLLELLGYERAKLEGQRLELILSAEARIFYQTHVVPLLMRHGCADELRLSMRSATGADVPVLANAARRERDGAAVSDWAVLPLRRGSRYKDELLQAKKAAEEASEARSRFLSMMSHDLRSPLSAISITAQVLYRGGRGPVTPEQQEDLRRIERASQDVLGMIADLLTYARMEAGQIELHLETVGLERVMARVESALAPRLEAGQIAYIRDDCEPAAVRADPERLQEILLNLLTNAVKVTDAGGRITVSCGKAGTDVLVRVRDTGCGIPTDQLGRIFEPFAKVERGPDEPKEEGVGLGLAISRELAHAMGGEVSVESTEGAGSVFTLRLPAGEPTG